jgi:hypothetical protein
MLKDCTSIGDNHIIWFFVIITNAIMEGRLESALIQGCQVKGLLPHEPMQF